MKTARKPLIVSVTPIREARPMPFPRVMWADYDPNMPKSVAVATYNSKADQRMTRPDLKPIRVLMVALERDDQSAIAEAIDVLNSHAEQGHKLNDRR